MGPEYTDYGLVFAFDDRRPCDTKIIEKAFQRLQEKNPFLKDVVFHSLRHASVTYKLKLNNGDIKATQGDSGHAEADMITQVYAHILDEDRKLNAQKFEKAFYEKPDLRKTEVPASRSDEDIVGSLVDELKKKPELADLLVQLLSKKE